jgi:hypothetical protein
MSEKPLMDMEKEHDAYCEGSAVCTLDTCPHKAMHTWTDECIHDGACVDGRTGNVMRCPEACLMFPNEGEFIPINPKKGRKYNRSWDVSVDLRGHAGEYKAIVRQQGGSRASLVIQVPSDLAELLIIEPGTVLKVNVEVVYDD